MIDCIQIESSALNATKTYAGHCQIHVVFRVCFLKPIYQNTNELSFLFLRWPSVCMCVCVCARARVCVVGREMTKLCALLRAVDDINSFSDRYTTRVPSGGAAFLDGG